MKSIACFAAALALLVSLDPTAIGQWGAGQCAPVGALAIAQVGESYRWVTRADTPGQRFLYRGNEQVGAYSFDSGFYRSLRNGRWTAPEVAPIRPPFGEVSGAGDDNLFGVDSGKLTGADHFSFVGAECSRQDVHELLENALPDDSKAGHVSAFVRDAALRKKVREDAAAALAKAGKPTSARIQVYDPDALPNRVLLSSFKLPEDTRFKQSGFKLVSQGPAVGPNNTARAESWHEYAGPEQIIEAIRVIDPTWNPNKPTVPSLPSIPSVPVELIGLGLLAVVVVIAAARS